MKSIIAQMVAAQVEGMITSAPVREGSSDTSGTLWWVVLARGQAPFSQAGSWLICQSEEERGELNPGVKLIGASCSKALGQGETRPCPGCLEQPTVALGGWGTCRWLSA